MELRCFFVGSLICFQVNKQIKIPGMNKTKMELWKTLTYWKSAQKTLCKWCILGLEKKRKERCKDEKCYQNRLISWWCSTHLVCLLRCLTRQSRPEKPAPVRILENIGQDTRQQANAVKNWKNRNRVRLKITSTLDVVKLSWWNLFVVLVAFDIPTRQRQQASRPLCSTKLLDSMDFLHAKLW